MTEHNSVEELLARAHDQLQSAIALLDLAAAPGQIAAHIDLAACQLADFIEANKTSTAQPMSMEAS